MVVFDMSGNEVKTLVNEIKNKLKEKLENVI